MVELTMAFSFYHQRQQPHLPWAHWVVPWAAPCAPSAVHLSIATPANRMPLLMWTPKMNKSSAKHWHQGFWDNVDCLVKWEDETTNIIIYIYIYWILLFEHMKWLKHHETWLKRPPYVNQIQVQKRSHGMQGISCLLGAASWLGLQGPNSANLNGIIISINLYTYTHITIYIYIIISSSIISSITNIITESSPSSWSNSGSDGPTPPWGVENLGWKINMGDSQSRMGRLNGLRAIVLTPITKWRSRKTWIYDISGMWVTAIISHHWNTRSILRSTNSLLWKINVLQDRFNISELDQLKSSPKRGWEANTLEFQSQQNQDWF